MARHILKINLLLLVAVVVGAAVLNIADGRRIKTQNRIVEEQKAERVAVFADKGRLDARILREGEELADLPDSLNVAKRGIAVKKSFVIAKEGQKLDRRIRKADRLIGAAREEISAARSHRSKWNSGFAIAAVALLIPLAVLKRLSSG